jgi:hypothetical protein
MKKIFSIMSLVLLFNIGASAKYSELFNYEEEAVNQSMAEMVELENYIKSNADVTYSTLHAENSTLISNLSASPLSPNFSFDDIHWGSFAWGFCCWPIGFFVVVTNKNKDSDQKMSFWIGLGTSVVLSAISGAGARSRF